MCNMCELFDCGTFVVNDAAVKMLALNLERARKERVDALDMQDMSIDEWKIMFRYNKKAKQAREMISEISGIPTYKLA